MYNHRIKLDNKKEDVRRFYDIYHKLRGRTADDWMETHYWPLFQGRILEVGAGTRLPTWIHNCDQRITYVALDFSVEALKKVSLEGLTGVLGDGEELPFENSSFNVVTCYDVLEHVTDPQAVISEMCRVSNDSVVFVGPNYVQRQYAPGLDRYMPWTLWLFLYGGWRNWYRLDNAHLSYDEHWEPDRDAISAVNAYWVARELRRNGFRIRLLETWGKRYPLLDKVPVIKHIGFFMFVVAEKILTTTGLVRSNL